MVVVAVDKIGSSLELIQNEWEGERDEHETSFYSYA